MFAKTTVMQTEEWVPISDFEGLYEVSDLGRVRSLERTVRSHGDTFRTQSAKIKDQCNNGDDYLIVSLYKNGKQHMKFVHRLVCAAFHPNPLNKKTVNHKDKDKTNNKKGNLEWATYKENNDHALTTGEQKPRGKAVVQISMEGNVISIFHSASAAAKATKVCRGSIAECVKPFRDNQGHSAGGFKWRYATEEEVATIAVL